MKAKPLTPKRELQKLRADRKDMTPEQCDASAAQWHARLGTTAAIRRHVEAAIGGTFDGHTTRPFYLGRSNFYCADHVFTHDRRQIRVFEKCHPREDTGIDVLLNGCQGEHFRTPFSFGSVQSGGYVSALWAWVDAEPVQPATADESFHASFGHAVAEFNAASDKLLGGIVIHEPRERFLVKDHLAELCATSPDEALREEAQESLRRYAAIEDEVQRRLLDLPQVVCHNDLHIGNILRGQGGTIYIVDWDSTSINPLGFDLNTLVNKPRKVLDMALSCYVDELHGSGIRTTVDAMHFSLTCSSVYRATRRLLRIHTQELNSLKRMADRVVGMLS